MKHFREPSSPSDYLELALESSSSALIGLQWILAQLPEEDRRKAPEADDRAGLRRQTSQAIEALRQAMLELRRARGDTAAQLALGFVVGAGGQCSSGLACPAGHSIPRRTA